MLQLKLSCVIVNYFVCVFCRYITSLDGVKRLQTVRLVDVSTMEDDGLQQGAPNISTDKN